KAKRRLLRRAFFAMNDAVFIANCQLPIANFNEQLPIGFSGRTRFSGRPRGSLLVLAPRQGADPACSRRPVWPPLLFQSKTGFRQPLLPQPRALLQTQPST